MSLEFDPDAAAEALCRLVGIDGLDIRDPLALPDLLGMPVVHVPHDRSYDGFFRAHPVMVGINFLGTDQELRARMAHELGHAALYISGVEMPHDEEQASAVGRAICMGRSGILRCIDTCMSWEITEKYKTFRPADVAQRVWEVRRSTFRKFG